MSTEPTIITINTETDGYGWIQWKSTDVCIDLYCGNCDTRGHLDADFMYYVQCHNCGTAYRVNGHIKLEPVSAQEVKDMSNGAYLFGKDDEDTDVIGQDQV
jgi:hypothetical protein